MDCQISDWLSQRGLVQNCRIHPAAEAAGILLEFYKQPPPQLSTGSVELIPSLTITAAYRQYRSLMAPAPDGTTRLGQ